MPGLLRGVARTAVIAGTATATSNAVNRRMATKNVEAYGNAQQQYQQETAQQPPTVAVGAGPSPGLVTPPTPVTASQDDQLAQLERLGQLKAQGVLTEEEFAQQKAKILGA
ncbi:MAG: SHOCT domain-containing protein [Coriobacteriales bacterium]|nr:SHOCT domain-containing protein [Coriobacteriales bacterium]